MDKSRPPGDGLADLVPVLGQNCLASCDPGVWQITWGVTNQGLVNVREPVSVAVYRLDDGVSSLVTVETIDALQYGYQRPGAVLTLSGGDWGDGIRVVVDECDEGNNGVELPRPACP